ncbi:hypothetical protein GEU84_019935 [Fertoebacter nigrum]|uniref:Uncharacterized protein n=1 Tax=Fertoeibacter niger TaxID=2656921 RepID=A0A8X8HAB8_9RHOB|nr:hypothetical protein [Fertoeibacter niger]NUB46666.1 hypothetical protein [Fertoeibacter niger]
MTTPFRIPLGARLVLLVFIAVQLLMLFDVFGLEGSPAAQLASGLAGLIAIGWIILAFLRHRKG